MKKILLPVLLFAPAANVCAERLWNRVRYDPYAARNAGIAQLTETVSCENSITYVRIGSDPGFFVRNGFPVRGIDGQSTMGTPAEYRLSAGVLRPVFPCDRRSSRPEVECAPPPVRLNRVFGLQRPLALYQSENYTRF